MYSFILVLSWEPKTRTVINIQTLWSSDNHKGLGKKCIRVFWFVYCSNYRVSLCLTHWIECHHRKDIRVSLAGVGFHLPTVRILDGACRPLLKGLSSPLHPSTSRKATSFLGPWHPGLLVCCLSNRFLQSNPLSRSLGENWTQLKEALLRGIKDNIMTKMTKEIQSLSWINHDIQKMVLQKDHLYKKAKWSKSANDWTRYKQCRHATQN